MAHKGIATISVDEVIYTGNSSIAVEITGYRHDVEAGTFIHTISATMTCVALDEDKRPSPGLPKLLDPLNFHYVKNHQAIAAQRKELAAQWRAVQEQVNQMPHVSIDMIQSLDYGRSLEVLISERIIEVQNLFLPKHLNQNNTIFGGKVLT